MSETNRQLGEGNPCYLNIIHIRSTLSRTNLYDNLPGPLVLPVLTNLALPFPTTAEHACLASAGALDDLSMRLQTVSMSYK